MSIRVPSTWLVGAAARRKAAAEPQATIPALYGSRVAHLMELRAAVLGA